MRRLGVRLTQMPSVDHLVKCSISRAYLRQFPLMLARG